MMSKDDDFLIRAIELLRTKRMFRVAAARQLLEQAPLTMRTLCIHGELLAVFLAHVGHGTSSRDLDGDAGLLASYFRAIVQQHPDILLHNAMYDEAVTFPQALEAMDEYAMPSWQGFEFVRGYLRTAMLNQARWAHLRIMALKPGVVDDGSPIYKGKPIYNGLNATMVSLSMSGGMGPPHPVLKAMVALKLFEPTAMINYLNAFSSALNNDGVEKSKNACPLPDTALGSFLVALRPLVADTQWGPQNPDIYAQLWDMHRDRRETQELWPAPWESAFIKAMFHSGPQALHHGLDYLHDIECMDIVQMQAFFPMPFEMADTSCTLKCGTELATTTGEMGSVKARNFLTLMDEHHPEMGALLRMHLQLSPNVQDARTNCLAMRQAFESLRQPSDAMHAEVDGSVFE